MSAKLYRGKHYGVFADHSGYYVAPIASNGKGHYRPADGGYGLSEAALEACNQAARESNRSISRILGAKRKSYWGAVSAKDLMACYEHTKEPWKRESAERKILC